MRSDFSLNDSNNNNDSSVCATPSHIEYMKQEDE